jgi:glyoxylase-like metal-dependent hydrolase (beta-lactamase superfamily II)
VRSEHMRQAIIGHAMDLPPTSAKMTVEVTVEDCGGGVLAIDSHMHGRPGVTAVYALPGPRPAIIETAAGSSVAHVLGGLEAAGITELDWIVLTHIHLDHAGAAGHLARRFPAARIVVRAEGAPHLVDPSRLWASAGRLYADMEGLWGEMLPIAPDRIDAVSADGPVADLGDGRSLVAVYTPGHAAHHMTLFEPSSGDAFTGDALGVYLAEVGAVHPATPPPEFDLEAALDSLDRIRALRANRLFPTHYGPVPATGAELGAVLDEAGDRLRRAVSLAEEVVAAGGGLGAITDAFAEEELGVIPGLDPALADRLAHTTSHQLNAWGVARYLTKRRGIPVPD